MKQNGFSYNSSVESSTRFYNFLLSYMHNHGLNPNEPNEDGFYPLEEAIHYGYSFYMSEFNLIDFKKKIPDHFGDSKFTIQLLKLESSIFFF